MTADRGLFGGADGKFIVIPPSGYDMHADSHLTDHDDGAEQVL